MTSTLPFPPHDTFGNPALVLFDQTRLAKLFGCSERTLERQRLEGTGIPFVRVGRLVRYRLVDVLQYLERQRRTSTGDIQPEGDAATTTTEEIPTEVSGAEESVVPSKNFGSIQKVPRRRC